MTGPKGLLRIFDSAVRRQYFGEKGPAEFPDGPFVSGAPGGARLGCQK